MGWCSTHRVTTRSTTHRPPAGSVSNRFPQCGRSCGQAFSNPRKRPSCQRLRLYPRSPGEDRADVLQIDARDVFSALGWPWDGSEAVALWQHLTELAFAEGLIYGGPSIQMRVTYAGLVRALDSTGNLLREAEDHLHAGRLRAAGCIAAVELERRLKQIVGRPAQVSHKRDPSLEDYNNAAFKGRFIDQETWESISTLAVIRKRCVHVLDDEPQVDEVRRLIEEVERILRRYPYPLRTT